jgi:hypothetical protein
MPKITKLYYLELTVEQFLSACSRIELEEINMRLDAHLRRSERTEPEWKMSQIQRGLDHSKGGGP